MSIERDHLISTAFSFGGRDIGVTVLHDGFSYWTDRTPLHKMKQQMGSRWLYDDDAAVHLDSIEHQHTLKAPVSDDAFARIRDELSPLYWADKPAPDEVLDSLLEPIFWEHIAEYFGVSR